MLSFLHDCITIWNSSDYIVIFFIMFILILILSDIRYSYSVKIAKKFNINIKREDIIFTVFFISTVIFLIFNLKYQFIGRFLGIVDYYDVGLSILRANIILSFLILYGLLSIIMPVICGVVAFRNNMDYKKWICYGFFLNLFALIYLLSIKVKESEFKK